MAENIVGSVSLINNIYILDAEGEYITDARVTKAVTVSEIQNTERYDLVLENGKIVGSVIYLIDIETINMTILKHSLTSVLFFITPVIVLFILLGVALIHFFLQDHLILFLDG